MADFLKNTPVYLFVFYGYFVYNFITFALFSYDKYVSKFNRVSLRISEKNLLGVSFAFGALGTTISMFLFRHKTQHKKFVIWLPICCVIQLMAVLYFFYTRMG